MCTLLHDATHQSSRPCLEVTNGGYEGVLERIFTTYSRFNVTAVLALQNKSPALCGVCYKVLQAVFHALCPFNVTAVPSWLRIREQNTNFVLNAYVEMINDLVVHQINQ